MSSKVAWVNIEIYFGDFQDFWEDEDFTEAGDITNSSKSIDNLN